jgi:hypothetical protein
VSAQKARGAGSRPSQKKSSPHQPGKGGKPPTGSKPPAGKVRERQAAQRALAQAKGLRADRNKRLWTVFAPIAIVVLAVAVLVVVKATSDGTHKAKKSAAAPATVIGQVTSVPASVFDKVGAGRPTGMPTRIDAPITADGKPRVLYIGAEYCPYCAVERWPMIVALSRFGTWHGLRYAYSAPKPEVYPNTATFSFHGATYTSKYLSFTGVETETNDFKPLDTLTAADSAIMKAHDAQGATPFFDVGGKFVTVGATYDPKVVAGRTQAEIAAALSDPTSDTGSGVVGAANIITAQLCEVTGGQPAQVCSSAGVTAAAKVLS